MQDTQTPPPRMAYDERDLLKKVLRNQLASCVVCSERLPYPFRRNKVGYPKIRCRKHQSSYESFFFAEYEDYLAVFRGQT